MEQITYNNVDYFFSKNTTFVDLLNREDLIVLPLSIWNNILKLKNGSVNPYDLYLTLERKIKHYDKSNNVNTFNFNNSAYWLDKNTRLGLMNLANCASDNIQVLLGDMFLEITPDNLKKFLIELEVYASKCFVNTQKHLLNIKQLRTVEDLINYDYTEGYPEKITLNE